MSSTITPAAIATPVVVPISRAITWLVGAALFAVALYYLVGVDQGAVSLTGQNTYVHEFVHDARHFLGFPCH